LAESGDLKVNPKIIELKTFLEQTVDSFRNHPVAKGRKIILQSTETKLSVDTRLLKRVLINMIKNAVEASREGDTVSVFGDCLDGKTTISVHNPSVMLDDVKLQVFKRSFSTKEGAGRGIGTYSIKLLGEYYLGGVVSFNSEHGEGTTFSISLPKD
jgi:signal transduction histidine kinase